MKRAEIMNDVKQIKVTIESDISDDIILRDYSGEYAFDGKTHYIVYTDYEGNDITKIGIQATEYEMLIHRSGGYNGKMFFSVGNDTLMDYDAFGLKTELILHTYEYSVQKEANELVIEVKYGLKTKSNPKEINGTQNMKITVKEDKKI